MRLTHRVLWLILAGFVAWPAIAAEPPLWRLVPQDSLGIAIAPDLGRTRESFQATPVGRLLAEPEMKEFLGVVRRSLETQLGDWVRDRIGVMPLDLLKSLNGEVGFALVGFDPQNRPRFLVSFEYGKNEPVVLALLERVLKGALGEDKKLQATEHLGVRIVTASGPRGETIAYAFAGQRLLVSLHPPVIQGAIARWKGAEGASLDTAPAFRDSRRELAGRSAGPENLILFLHGAEIWKQHGKDVPRDWQAALRALGVSDWEALAYASRFDDQKAQDALHIRYSGERRGLARVLAPAPLERGMGQGMVPSDAVGWAVGRFDARAAWEEGFAALKAFDQESHDRLVQAVERLEQRSRVRLPAFFKTLGTRYVAWARMPHAGLGPQWIQAMEIADPEAYLIGLRGLGRALEMELVATEYGSRQIYHLQARQGKPGTNPFDLLGPKSRIEDRIRFLALLFSSHFYLDRNWLYSSNLHQNLLDHIDLLARGPHEAKDLLAPEGAVAHGGAVNAPVMVGLYATLLPFLGGIEGLARTAGAPYDSRFLPRASTLLKHLGPSEYALTAGAQGVTYRSSGNATRLGVASLVILPIAGAWARAAREAAAAGDIEWYCPMHPSVVRSDGREKCPTCGMSLVQRTRRPR